MGSAASSAAGLRYSVTLKGSWFHSSVLGRVVGKGLGRFVRAKANRAMKATRRWIALGNMVAALCLNVQVKG